MPKALTCLLKQDIHDHVNYKVVLGELRRLAEALGYEVVGEVVQTRPDPSVGYLFGRGKVKEISELVKRHDVDEVFVYNVLTSKQKLNLRREFGVEVADRYDLTLRIFEENATDSLSKLQIELARLRKLFPLYKLEASIILRTEHPSLRSMGEYAYHKRITSLRRRIAKIRGAIRRLKAEKIRRIKRRRELGFKMVCISGYYNAGKTSLFNTLTGSRKPVSDRPFTTLSSKYQRRYFGESSVLFIDTIGFVVGLDPSLIGSFELNLEDLRSSDIVLFLVDASDPIDVLSLKLKSGLAFLREIGVDEGRTVVVLNKIDLVGEGRMGEILAALGPILGGCDRVSISARERMNIPQLLETIAGKLRGVEGPMDRPD